MSSPPQNSVSSASASRRWLLLVFGALLPLFCFGWLAETVWNRNGLRWDAPALHFGHQFTTPSRDSFMVAVTETGDVRTVIIFATMTALGLAVTRRRKDARFLALCIIGTALAAYLTKTAFHRARPHFWESPAPETDFVFPSGHAMDTLAFTFGLAVIAWQTRGRWPVIICGSIYVAAVGASRLYLGAHYPSDVMGGWALAAAWLCGSLLILTTAQASTTRRRKPALIAVGKVAGITTCFGAYILSDLKHDNLRVVVPGKAYRAGLMSTNALAACIEEYGIRSILNLRGENSDANWHKAEIALTRELHLSHYDRSLSAGMELNIEEMDNLVSLMREAPKPILIHCDGGADHSVLVSALYLFAIEGRRPEEADKELSIWNGHLPLLWPRVAAMDHSFWHFVTNRATLVQLGLSPSPSER
jgi:membrane-associated phospholipid phosphatase